jgi:hypothetical protein
MWIKQLGEMYSESLYKESWGPSSPNMPGDARGMLPARETKDSVRMKGIFGAGDSPSNALSVSQASGQNPFEQEEDQMISKNTIMKMIGEAMNGLDSKNKLDQSAVFALGNLKNKVKGL